VPADGTEGWPIDPATIHDVRAAIGKGTSRRKLRQVGRLSGNRSQIFFSLRLGEGSQQAAGVGMAGGGKQRFDGGLLHDPPRVHHRNGVTGFRHHAEIVGDKENRRFRLLPKIPHQIENLRLDGDIQRRGRLIGDQQFRLADEGCGNDAPLAHPPLN